MNEKSISTPQQNAIKSITQTTLNTGNSNSNSPRSTDSRELDRQINEHPLNGTSLKSNYKRNRLHNQQRRQHLQKHKHEQLASPPQDQVSSTQDQFGSNHESHLNTIEEDNSQDGHDCQTSPLMLVTTQTDDLVDQQGEDLSTSEKQVQDNLTIKHVDQSFDSMAQTISSPPPKYELSKTTLASTTTTSSTSNSSSSLVDGEHDEPISSIRDNMNVLASSQDTIPEEKMTTVLATTTTTATTTVATTLTKKRKLCHSTPDQDTSSNASWLSSCDSQPSPMSTSSISSSSSHCSSSSSSTCSSLSPSPSSSPISSPDIINELRGPRLKLSEDKIRKIKRRPVVFDEFYNEHSFASTPTTSSGCSPGQHSTTTQNSDQFRLGIPTSNLVIHMFQAPPKFVNNLKPCNLTPIPQETSLSTPPPVAVTTKDMLNCAICGIKDRPSNISKVYGQNSCLLCTKFFASFIKRPKQWYCAQDGDCLMTFDSRCKACWIKICLQKFDIEEEHRKVGQRYSPKLLSSPNVSLITIDTSLSR